MFAALALEWVGHDQDVMHILGKPVRRPWVAEVTDMRRDGRVAGRRFIDGRLDYAEANSIGSRGVKLHYLLPAGPVYEVRSYVSWQQEDRYLCRCDNGQLVRLTPQEAWEYGIDQQAPARH